MNTDNGRRQLPDTESRILQAAEREFMSKGFNGARTTTIAETAGVTHAMFHYYFRTKEKLFERIVAEKVEMLRDAFVGSLGAPGLSLEQTIRNFIDSHLDFISANPDLPRFLIGELYTNPERAAIVAEGVRKHAPFMIAGLQSKIDHAAEKGECRRVDAWSLILDMVSLNVFSFLATPIVNAALDSCMADQTAFIARRKLENFDTIMRKLRP